MCIYIYRVTNLYDTHTHTYGTVKKMDKFDMCHNFPKSKFRLSLASAAPRTPVLLGQGFFGLKVETWQLRGCYL